MPKMIYYLILVHIIISGNCIWRINIEDWYLFQTPNDLLSR